MPDGKRNQIPPEEGESEGVNCFYDEDLQNNGNNPLKRIPLNLGSRSLHHFNERLLRAMVANEIKKTLDADDNKKLVAHHRPVLQSENEASDSEMVVFGVVLSAKQSQNDEVSKAIDMLRRNGVSCVCFTLNKDTGTKKDDSSATAPSENGLSEELLRTFKDFPQQHDENCLSPEDTTEKKVSSPTVSTTSDYASPPPPDDLKSTDVTGNDDQSPDTSCTSTTSPTDGNVDTNTEKDGIELLPVLSPANRDGSEDQDEPMEQDAPPSTTEIVQSKLAAQSLSAQRKKRRKRLYPYVSRRRARSRRKKIAPVLEVAPQDVVVEQEEEEEEEEEEKVVKGKKQKLDATAIKSEEVKLTNDAPVTLESAKADPYEFDDSDMESSAPPLFDAIKVPTVRNGVKNVALQSKKNLTPPKAVKTIASNRRPSKRKKSGARKGSPRKRLTFSKVRAFSPDITDHVDSTIAPQRRSAANVGVAKFGDAVQPDRSFSKVEVNKQSPKESCVQPISTDSKKLLDTTQTTTDDNNSSLDDVKLVHPPNGLRQHSPEIRVSPPKLSPQHCDANIRTDQESNDVKEVIKHVKTGRLQSAPPTVAQGPSSVQTKHPAKSKSSSEPSDFLVPATPNDSLPDAPDSMQLRRSSFYSSISRNVRTNMDKYLDGRPQDLKTPKRSKKIKNGFLLHHGDNFPDDPEAPYQLHLATQVLLKLNKRRVKCKPKEDKGKSLLSYLKLQPRRVSRVGKHSKPVVDTETLAAKETSSVFSGEWTVARKFICNICGQIENAFWDMVMHKGEVHPGIVVTHVELPNYPPEGFRGPQSPRLCTTLPNPPPCSKCSATFTAYSDLHRHVFECAGNEAVLEDTTSKAALTAPRKKRSKRKRGFKRRISSLPKKNANTTNNNNSDSNNTASSSKSTTGTGASAVVTKSGEITKRRNSEVFKCEFCTREFKTEGWLKNHVSVSHSLPVSIPLEKLSLPTRASFTSSRRHASVVSQLATATKPSKPLSRET